MKNELNILHISPNFNFVCGVSKYVFLILKELKSFQGKQKLNLFFITNGGDSLNRLDDIGIKPYIMEFEKGLKNIIYIKKNLSELENFCINNKIDIIHTHHRYPELLSNLLKKKFQIKTITTVHSLVDGFRYLSFRSDLILAVSKAVELNIKKKFNVPKERILQLYNPIDFNEIENYEKVEFTKANLNLPDNSILFTFIGRWDKNKGVDLLIDAFEQIIKYHSEVYLMIISNLSFSEKRIVEKLHKNFLIIKPQKNILEYYKVTDVIILPSRRESFPFVMLEAGLFKKLFLGSNVDGIAEFIDDGRSGLLFHPNSEEIIEFVEIVLSMSNEEKILMSENLHNKVMSLDNPTVYAKKLIELYFNMIK